MSTKYSRVKGPQGLPKTCKRQPPYCDDVTWPPPTIQGLITFHGVSTIGSNLSIVEVLRPKLTTPPGNVWHQTIIRPCYRILFDFETNALNDPIACQFNIIERGLTTGIAWYGMQPYTGPPRYDTLEQTMLVTVGSARATFRVLL
jgi:hypothetical protein